MSENRAYDQDYILYFHRNATTEEIFYVGIGRPERARKFIGRGKRWHAYVNKHGTPTVEIYRNNLSSYEALYLESHFIKMLGRRKINANGVLINVTSGGDASMGLIGKLNPSYGRKLTAEQKMKMQEGRKKNPVSEETRRKWSEARKGNQHWRKRTPEGTQRIIDANKRRAINKPNDSTCEE